jgi:folate-binding protein YgfZ
MTELGETPSVDFEAGYRAVRTAAGLRDLSEHAKIVATGGDRLAFLDAILSQALKDLLPGSGRHAAFLTVQGRVIADLRAYVRAEDVLLEAAPENREKLLTGLRRYIISEDVRLRDVTEELALLALDGPRARSIAEAVLGRFPALAAYDCAEAQLGAEPVLVAHSRELGEDGYHFFIAARAAGALRSALQVAGGEALRRVGREAAEALRLEAGTAQYGPDFDEGVILTEAGLEDAVSYQKGCYIGQEVIARIKFRGHVNRHLVGLRLEGTTPPPARTPLYHEEREVGQVTSAAFSPALGVVVALGYLRREVSAPGSRVVARENGSERPAEVTPTPFVTTSAE